MKYCAVETLSRYGIENEFFVREPYALITIRRPGSKFANPMCRNRCIARCDLMLHEWDIDDDYGQCKLVRLSIRQSLKVVEFVSQHRNNASRLVIQSDLISSQLVAIAETLAMCLDVPITRAIDWKAADKETAATLEMAIDSTDLLKNSSMKARLRPTSLHDDLFSALLFVVGNSNVAMVSSPRLQDCQRIREMDRLDFDAAMGIRLEYDTPKYERCHKNADGDWHNCDYRHRLYTYAHGFDVPLCPFGGCAKCLKKLTLRKWSVCLGLISDPRHLPPTFDRVLDAGGTWVILTNSAMSDRITAMNRQTANIRLTQHPKVDLQLLTLDGDHNWSIGILHDLLLTGIGS